MTYASKLRTKLDPKSIYNQTFPGRRGVSPEMIDAAAERLFQQKMYGGFSKNNKCSVCNELKSKNGSCSCS